VTDLSLRFKPIGSAIRTHKLSMILSIAGGEQELTATVRYVNVPGNPARFDEPARADSVEILSVIVNDINIDFMLNEQTMKHIAEEVQ
jgi:hypothetical protein